MAVTALSGQRWQGSSTGDPVSRYLKLTELDSDSSNQSASYDMYSDLGDSTLSGTWIIRFKLYYSAIVTSGAGDTVNIGITTTTSAVSPTGSNTGMGFKWASDEGGAVSYSSGSMFPAPDEFVPETHATAPITKYFEMIRSGSTGTDTFTVNVYTESDYSDTPATSTQSALGITGLRYIKVANYDGSGTGSTTGTISDMYLWDNTTTAGSIGSADVAPTFEADTWLEQNSDSLGVGATYTDEKTTVTDVPVGSEFEQTDDYKTYQRFSSTGNTYTWTDCGSDNPMTITNGVQSTGAWIRAGTLIGTKITKITQKLYRVGTASGNLVCHQINSGDTSTIKATSSTVAISGLTDSTVYGSATSVDFDFATPVEIAVNDCFIVSSDGSPCKLWSDGGDCDSNNTNWMESDDQSPPTFTEQTGYTARGSATYTDEGWRERGTAI